MLARLQRRLILGLAATALAWVALTWHGSGGLFWGGLALLAFGHALFLAFEFALMHALNRHDSAPRATLRQLAGAWLSESLQAPRVFAWHQPFRANARPDRLAPGSPPGPGVVLVHGFFCNRGFWNPWLRALNQRGRVHAAVSLEPLFGSIDAYDALVDRAVRQVYAATGRPVLVVCHSMGGLAVRAWLRRASANDDRDALIARVITLGTPHQGTWLGQLSLATNGQQMQLGSDWLRELAASEPAERRARFTCYYSNCDNIVFPTLSATLPGADNRFLPGVAHVAMAFHPTVMAAAMAALDFP